MLRNIPKLYAVRILFWMHFFAAVLVPFYTEWGGISLAQVFYLNAWFMLWNFILEVPAGTVADHLGRKWSLAVGSLFGIAACLTYASHPGLPTFLIAEVLFACAYCLHSGADEALAYDSLAAGGRELDARRTIALMESFKLAGIIISAVLGGFIAFTFGLRATMAAYVVPSVIAFLIVLTLKEPVVQAAQRIRPRYRDILRDGFDYFFRHPVLMVLTLDMALTNAVAWALIWLFQPLLARAGLSMAYFGLVHVAMCAAQILFLQNMERLERWAGSRLRLIVVSGMVSGVFFILLGAAKTLPVVIAALPVAAVGLARSTVFSGYLNRHIPSDKRATVLSISSMMRTLAIVIVNPVSGWMAEWSLSGAMYALGGALILLPLLSGVKERHLADPISGLPGASSSAPPSSC